MPSFTIVYLACVVAAAAIFGVLAYLGPPPPVTYEKNVPEQAETWRIQMNNDSFAGWDAQADQLWDALVPNGGIVLATNLTSGLHFWAQAAMFHQLKCLRDIRAQVSAMARSWDAAEALVDRRGPGSDYESMGFCFDYVRQGLLCHADTTLHPKAVTGNDKFPFVIDGNALWHLCRDNTGLHDWAIRSGPPHKDPRVYLQPPPKL